MKSLKIKSSSFFIVILTILIHVSCRKQYDEPPITQIPDGNVITISDLKGMYAGSDLSISEDYNIYANVTTDETDGNFYKEAYIQDATGAIRLRLLASGGLYIGDSIRINLNGTVLSEYNGMIQVDSVDVDKNIVKQATQKFISPTTYSVNQISPALQGYLVQLNDWNWGHYVAVGNDVIHQYKMGDIHCWPEGIYHCTGNAGLWPRYCLTITGCVTPDALHLKKATDFIIK